MSKASLLRKLGVAARVAGQQAGRSRTLSAILGAAKTTARSFGRAAHMLWLEVTGVIFLVMALSGGAALVREYMKYSASHTNGNRVVLAMAFTVTFAWFGVSSFWRVRRRAK